MAARTKVGELRARYTQRLRRTTRARVQHRPARGARARLPARLRRDDRRLGPRPEGEPRRPQPARTSRSATTPTSCSHTLATRGTTASRPGLQAGDDHQVPAQAAGLLAEGRDAGRAPHPPLRPRARQEAALRSAYHGRVPTQMDRVLDLLHKVKYEQDGSLTFRRSCAHGVCGSDAMLINGRNRLACKIRVDQLGRQKITVAPLPGLPLIKDLVVDMEAFFDKFRSVQPYLQTTARRPSASGSSRPRERERSTTRPSASCAPRARRPARRSGPSPSTSGRRRSSTPTGSSSTRATTRPTSGWRSSPTRTACGAAGRSSTAPTPARGGSTSPRRSSRSVARGIVSGAARGADASRSASAGHPAPASSAPTARRAATPVRPRSGAALYRRLPARRARAHRAARTPRSREALGVQTNNVAEWTGVVEALELAHRLGAEKVHLFLDSKLIVEQLHGRWRVKDAKLHPAPRRGEGACSAGSGAGPRRTCRGPRTRPPTGSRTRRSTGSRSGGRHGSRGRVACRRPGRTCEPAPARRHSRSVAALVRRAASRPHDILAGPTWAPRSQAERRTAARTPGDLVLRPTAPSRYDRPCTHQRPRTASRATGSTLELDPQERRLVSATPATRRRGAGRGGPRRRGRPTRSTRAPATSGSDDRRRPVLVLDAGCSRTAVTQSPRDWVPRESPSRSRLVRGSTRSACTRPSMTGGVESRDVWMTGDQVPARGRRPRSQVQSPGQRGGRMVARRPGNRQA